jgi:hypothetical protein
MCAQCVLGAAAAATTATGVRAWLVARAPRWLTVRRKKTITAVLVAGGVLAAGLIDPV